MIKSQIEYYRKLQRFLYLKELENKSILNEINEGLVRTPSRYNCRIADSKEESLKPFDEKRIPTEEEFKSSPLSNAKVPIDGVRTGARIVLSKEKKKIRKER